MAGGLKKRAQLKFKMLIEFQWIDAKIRGWLGGTESRSAVVDVSPASLQAALLTLEERAPSLLTKYRAEFPNFDELYRIAGLMNLPVNSAATCATRSDEKTAPANGATMKNSAADAFIFTGTLDGPDDLDLVELSGLSLSETELETLWSETSATEIIRECESVIEREIDEIDEMPTQSEKYFEYECRSREEFCKEIAQVITSILKK